MRKWTVIFIIGIIGFIGVYALNSYLEELKDDREVREQEQRSADAAQSRKLLNESLTAYFKENFQRQNNLGNETISQIFTQTQDIDKMLIARTPRFDNIEGNLSEVITLFKSSLENQRTIIHNQYEFAKQMNVSNVSNKTH